ncbi:MAG: YceD family protein [Propionibacteriaceae bacterium]|nr:YceD family protein [Propionibacteriaceae bacterium]
MSTEFELSLVDLKRTPGSLKDFFFEAGFDEPVDVGLISLPQGRPIAVEGNLQSVGDGVLVTASASGELDYQCARCLKSFSDEVEVDILEMFVYPEHEKDYEEEEVGIITEEMIDLTDCIREAVILDQPLNPVCSADCQGLCTHCGADLNSDPDHHHDEPADSPWMSLGQ